MLNRWSDSVAAEYVARYGKKWGEDLAMRTYLSVLVGGQENLVLHGGGNNSVKTCRFNVFGELVSVIFVKASGNNMAHIEPDGYTGLDLEYLRRLRFLESLSDEEMVNELRTHFFDCRSAPPSIETLVHAFIPKKFIDHTHADAILALSNQEGGQELLRKALGPDTLVLSYETPGFRLAQASAAAFDANPGCKAMVWMHHGLLSWGETARESYETTVEIIAKAEDFLVRMTSRKPSGKVTTTLPDAWERVSRVAPLARGLLARASGNPDRPWTRVIVRPLVTREVLDLVDSGNGREVALSPAMAADHLIRTKAFPLWIDDPQYDDAGRLKIQLHDAIRGYCAEYDAYIDRHRSQMPEGLEPFDSLPRVILMPGLGALCEANDAIGAGIVRDIAAHTLTVKSQIAAAGGKYKTIPEDHRFEMEYRRLQHAKLHADKAAPLGREVALITGAAGAIGSGIAAELLEQGCHVAVTDLPGTSLDELAAELDSAYPSKVLGVELDATDPSSVAAGFSRLIQAWGGVDIVVINQGVALVRGLPEMDLESFRRLERINVEGTLLLLREAARHFSYQGTGGDIILVSTKNVFSPGAKFGAYSATKTAAHQLARIASLELAGEGVRVNMVSPDAVFSHRGRKSGLWAEIGPDRMKARGLDEAGLEEYYRNRNLLKAGVTARHVGKAVVFLATRQIPVTGTTIPVDGGLPDATPR